MPPDPADLARPTVDEVTRPMLAAVAAFREWLAGPPAPDEQVRTWKLYSGMEYGGVYCAEPDCGCAAENSEILRGDDGGTLVEGEEATFTLADLHKAIGEHIAHRAAIREEEARNVF